MRLFAVSLGTVLLLVAAPVSASAADRDYSDFDNQRQAERYYAAGRSPTRTGSTPTATAGPRQPALPLRQQSSPPAATPAQAARPQARPDHQSPDDRGDRRRHHPRPHPGGHPPAALPRPADRDRHPRGLRRSGMRRPPASASLRRRATGRRMLLRTDPSQDTFDRYGRLLAYANLRGGPDAGAAQLHRGWAKVYVYRDPFRRLAAYRRAQRSARAADRGVWRRCGGRFHRPQR